MNYGNDLPLWLTDDVTWPVLWGLLVIGIFCVIWFVSRQYRYLFLAFATVALVVGALLVEQRVVTDKEYLVNAVYQMAESVRNNDAEGIVQFVRDDNEVFAEKIRRNMKLYNFHGCRVIGFSRTDVDTKQNSPQKALIGFAVWATASYGGQLDKLQQANVTVNLEFQKTDGVWTVEAYGYRPSNTLREIKMTRN